MNKEKLIKWKRFGRVGSQSTNTKHRFHVIRKVSAWNGPGKDGAVWGAYCDGDLFTSVETKEAAKAQCESRHFLLGTLGQ